jgi:1-acyl-sn-glycerol-3-phosphate acyltransferase
MLAGGVCHVPVFTPPVNDESDRPPAPAKRRRAAKNVDDHITHSLTIRLLALGNRVLARLWHRTVVLRRPTLPKHGAAILVCNHTSGLDPFLLQSVLDRVVIWMMAKEYYDIKAMTWFFRAIEAIPVDRDGRDMASVRAGLRCLKQGRILGVFAEGRIETSRELLPFQTGVAMMAIRAGVPVFPAYLDGSQRNKNMLAAFLWPNRVTLAFGPPVQFDRTDPSREGLEAATARIREAVGALRTK